MVLFPLMACSEPPIGSPTDEVRPVELPAGTVAITRAAVVEGPGPLARGIVVELSGPSPVAVACEAVDDPTEAHLLESPAATTHDLRLLGLRGATSWQCAAVALDPPSAPVRFAFDTADVTYPSIREARVLPGHARPRGYLLTNVGRFRARPSMLALFDPDGTLRWGHALPDGVKLSVEALPDYPSGLWWGGGEIVSSPRRVDFWEGVTFAETWPGGHESHHDGKRLADGRLLSLEVRPNQVGAVTFDGFGIRIHDPKTNRFDLEYSSQADVDAGRLPPPRNADDLDPWHANWADYRDGLVYVSLCGAESIVAIDVATEQIVWTFGEGGDFAVFDLEGNELGAEGFPHCQHGLEVSADGEEWLVYDNGRGRPSSRIVRYTLDPDARSATLTWQWTEPGWSLPVLGDVDELADGLLVTMGDLDEVSRYVRLGLPAEVVTWEATLGPPGNAYRAEWLDGCAIFASVRECAGREARYAELRSRLFP